MVCQVCRSEHGIPFFKPGAFTIRHDTILCRVSKQLYNPFSSATTSSGTQPATRTTLQQNFPQSSGILTLVPLSETTSNSRKRRSLRTTILYLIIFAAAIASTVYILVPRDVTVGQVVVVPDKIDWSASKPSYSVRLNVTIPVYNPNYLASDVHGKLDVLFFDAIAGETRVNATRIPGRSFPTSLTLQMDASGVPQEYILSILSQCTTFPHVLTFFLQGNVYVSETNIFGFLFGTSSFWGGEKHVAEIDTYFMLDC
jgi:hypothetical protein